MIGYADLSLLIRCRALCILGCSDEGDYVHYVEQSVHFAKLGLAASREAGSNDTDGKGVLEGCEEGLAAAKAAKADADAKAGTAASAEGTEVKVEKGNEQDDDTTEAEVVDEEDEEEEAVDEQVVVIRDVRCGDEEDPDDKDEG